MTNYFSHDIDADKDPKCSALIAGHGMEGYGIYWCLIEILHQQDGKIKKFPKLYEGLAFLLRTEVKQIEAMVQALVSDYELLKEDENYIWSDRVLKNLEEREKKKLAKQISGRIGGQNSGKSRAKTKQNEAVLQKNEANEPKEKKVKEIKEEIDKSIGINAKDGEIAKAYGEPEIDLIVEEFAKRISHIPADRKPRQVAQNIRQLIHSFIKREGEVFQRLRGEPLTFNYVLDKSWDWYMQKDYAASTEKLEAFKLKMKVFLDDVSKQLAQQKEVYEQTRN